MASLLGRLYFWTLKENALNQGRLDIGCHSYRGFKGLSTSKVTTAGHQQRPNYYEELKTFTENCGLVWSPVKKRPDKVRETIKEIEELLSTSRCVYCSWYDRNRLKLMFNSGVVFIIRVKAGVGDVEKISVDKFLVGRLFSDHVVDVIFKDTSILVSYVEPKLTHIQLVKKTTSTTPVENMSKKWEKLSSLDPKISHVDLIGPAGRRIERKLSCNVCNDQILVWWMSSGDEVWPWTPISTDRERANVHVYSIGDGAGIRFICRTRSKGDPIWMSYGRLHTYRFNSIEQRTSRKGDVCVDICAYEVLANKIQRLPVTTIPIESAVVCHAMNDAEDRIVLGCRDGSLVVYGVYDVHCKATRIIQASFIPSTISWHPSGTVFAVSNDDDHGRISCYDLALCRIQLRIVSNFDDDMSQDKPLDLASYLGSQSCTVQRLAWMPEEFVAKDAYGYYDNTHSLLVLLERGPLALLVFRVGVHGARSSSLSPFELCSEYLNHSQLNEAVNLLLNLNWNVASEVCYTCLSLIVNRLLNRPLTADNEVQLESALGSFYSPYYSLSDVVLLEYGNRMRCLARRFFHHLLRREKFEKAFLLAADIGSRDLFMDMHYVALDRNERILAHAALDRARQLDMDSSNSSSSMSSVDSRQDTMSSSSRTTTSSASDDDDEPRIQHSSSINLPPGDDARQVDWPIVTMEPLQRTIPMLTHRDDTATRDEDTYEVEDDEEGGTVHVVHFGVV